jgi:hypothetical protein
LLQRKESGLHSQVIYRNREERNAELAKGRND